jgi:hypothetical protein
MVCPYPFYLKQSLGQTVLYKILSYPKTFLFPVTSQKIHSLPICIFSSCLLCNLYFKINFYKNFRFIIGLKQLIGNPCRFKEFMIGIRPYCFSEGLEEILFWVW